MRSHRRRAFPVVAGLLLAGGLIAGVPATPAGDPPAGRLPVRFRGVTTTGRARLVDVWGATGPGGRLVRTLFSPDGKLALSVSHCRDRAAEGDGESNVFRLRDVATGREVVGFRGHAVAETTAEYFYKRQPITSSPTAQDDRVAALLWERSAALAGLKA